MVLKNKIYLQNYNAVIDTWSETNITFNRWVIRPDWSKLYVGPTGIVQPELKAESGLDFGIINTKSEHLWALLQKTAIDAL